jgi:hypothetical protein
MEKTPISAPSNIQPNRAAVSVIHLPKAVDGATEFVAELESGEAVIEEGVRRVILG